jgi:hypothetical protein
MPPGVQIESSDSPIRFLPDGSIDGVDAATTVLRTELGGGHVEYFTVTTSVNGIPTVDRSPGS